MQSREINKMIDEMMEIMASTGNKDAVFANESNKLSNKVHKIFSAFIKNVKEDAISDETLERYIEFYKQINGLFDEFMKGEKIGC